MKWLAGKRLTAMWIQATVLSLSLILLFIHSKFQPNQTTHPFRKRPFPKRPFPLVSALLMTISNSLVMWWKQKSSARCTVRLNNTKTSSLEQRKFHWGPWKEVGGSGLMRKLAPYTLFMANKNIYNMIWLSKHESLCMKNFCKLIRKMWKF